MRNAFDCHAIPIQESFVETTFYSVCQTRTVKILAERNVRGSTKNVCAHVLTCQRQRTKETDTETERETANVRAWNDRFEYDVFFISFSLRTALHEMSQTCAAQPCVCV